MNKELFESTEFYNKRYKNFSTIIIIPIFILLLGLIVFIFMGKMEITVNGSGNIMPVSKIVNVTSSNNINIVKKPINNQIINKGQTIIKYKDGKKVKSPFKGIFYKNNDSDSKSLGHVYPTINNTNKLMTKVYVTSKDIVSVQKGQKITMSLPNDKKNMLIKGYVKDYSSLPTTYKENIYYVVTCYLNPNNKDIKNILYGMNGNVSINTSKVSMLEYIKNKIV
ncbi:HlyD family efflux transporter periplasmic adaptor subunit [Apilactobacillus micheneri]|uniref:HlyD family efflux transporter periplasmic adaptor subunit n=1 Tax=Apilactobacillus micheneri TaxID=1899430 RepID=UPI000D03DE3B|nr:HlyD family efflux transporter periplasmic adaptor subunit [Apilactobacillus micheneri]